MKQSRFTMNAFLLIVVIFSAIFFVSTLLLSGIADRTAINDFYRIEGTDYGILYSNRKASGIYEGSDVSGELRLEGTFGHDWGIALEGNQLYINEYTYTDMRTMMTRVVRIDLSTFEKDTLYPNAILRGRCASGELVCIGNFLMPSNAPETNPMCTLYSMTAPDLDPDHNGSLVMIIDPKDGELLYQAEDTAALEDFEEKYLSCTLEEIKNR